MAVSTLLRGVRAGKEDLVQRALERDVDINCLLDEDCGQWTPLHLMAADGDADACRMLIKYGASVSMACAGDQYQPLHLAARNGQVEAAEALLENGASLDAVDKHGYTPLHYAAGFGHALMASVLLRKGASSLAKDGFGCTPAQLAKAAGHEDTYVVIATSATVEQGVGRVARWLTGIGLVQHVDAFAKAGFDDLAFIAEVGLEEADVDKLGVEPLAHRKKLIALYKIQEYLGAAAPAPGGEAAPGSPDESKGTDGASEAAASDASGSGDGDSDDDDGDDSGDGDGSDDGSDDDSGSGDDGSGSDDGSGDGSDDGSDDDDSD